MTWILLIVKLSVHELKIKNHPFYRMIFGFLLRRVVRLLHEDPFQSLRFQT